MNLPNKLTILRIILVIPFIVVIAFLMKTEKSLYYFLAGGIFAFAMLTDFWDGYLARKWKQITVFGKLFDPLADKFITTTTCIALSIMGIIPFYITLLFVLRDLLVDGSRNVAARNKISIAAGFMGKAKTMLMSLGFFLIFIVRPFIHGEHDYINPSWEIWILISPILVAVILSTISGFNYFKAIVPFLK